MHELKERDTWRASELFDDLRYNLVVDSVIAGHTPAWVVVDDVSNPRTAWMWNRMGTMLLAGDPGNKTFNRLLSRLLQERVAPDARHRRIPSLTLHYSPDPWEGEIDHLLPSSRPAKMGRRFYTFGRLEVDWREELPSDCVMRRISWQLLHGQRPRNLDNVLGWIHSFWHTTEDFMETGFGFCLVRGEVVVSWCLTVYASGSDFELGLATALDYRNRGYATLTAAACVEHCLEKGYTPHWHCDETNQPSIRVAEKIGFSNPTGYQVYKLAL